MKKKIIVLIAFMSLFSDYFAQSVSTLPTYTVNNESACIYIIDTIGSPARPSKKMKISAFLDTFNIQTTAPVTQTITLTGGATGSGIDTIEVTLVNVIDTAYADNAYVPYAGATKDVNLNGNSLHAIDTLTIGTPQNSRVSVYQSGNKVMDLGSTSKFGTLVRIRNVSDSLGKANLYFDKLNGSGTNQVGAVRLAKNGVIEFATGLDSAGLVTNCAEISDSVTSFTTNKMSFFSGTPVTRPAAITTSQGIADALTSLGLLSTSTVTSTSLFTDAGAYTYLTSTSDLFGVGTNTVTASMQVKGQGSSSVTVNQYNENSSGTALSTLDNIGTLNLNYAGIQLKRNLVTGAGQIYGATDFVIGNGSDFNNTAGILFSGTTDLILKGSGGTFGVLRSSGASYLLNSQFCVGASSPDASAKLQVVSTTQGFLPPLVTTAQKNAISSPATGLIVYDTTLNKICVYTGAAWETVTSL